MKSFLFILILLATNSFASGDRIALVIGNSKYAEFGVLANPANDARDINKVLTEMGYFKDKEGRTALIDICEIIQQKEYDKFKFILIDAQGDEVRGRVSVCTAIRDFEVDVTTDIKNALGFNVVKTYFDYSPKYDFKNKIFELDLQDQDPNVEIADIVQSQKGELLLPNGKNKYKDVYITYSVS